MAHRRLIALGLIAVLASGCGEPAPHASAPSPSPPPSPTSATPTTSPTESASPTRPAVDPAVQRIADAFEELAKHPDATTAQGPPFADRVALGLGSTILATAARSELARPATWDLVLEGYAGRSGALSPIAGIRQFVARGGATVVSTGPHDHCASPPLPVADGYGQDLQVVIQPSWDDIDSCLEWFSVDLFVREGRIVAVTLSLFEP